MVEVITFTLIVCASIPHDLLKSHPPSTACSILLTSRTQSFIGFHSTWLEIAHTIGVAHSANILVKLYTKIPSMADGGLVVQVTQHQSEVDCSC